MNEILNELNRARGFDIRISLNKEDLEEAEPSTVAIRDIVSILKESVKRSLKERGEAAIGELIAKMPEDKASLIVKSLANEDRIRILKLLYSKPASFSQLRESLKLESSSLAYNLRQLLSIGLIYHDEVLSEYKISSRGRTLLRLLALIYESIGGEIHE